MHSDLNQACFSHAHKVAKTMLVISHLLLITDKSGCKLV